MVSFIILSILLFYISIKSIKYTLKHFTPLALILFVTSFSFLLLIWDIKYKLINFLNIEVHFSMLAKSDFYWVLSLLIMIAFIILRDIHRNLYFEKTTTDLVRKLAIENAKKVE